MLPNDGQGVVMPRLQTTKQRLERAEVALTQLIDFTMAIAAMNMVAGHFTLDQIIRMEKVVKEARRRIGKDFTFEEGMKAVVAAFKIEIQGDEKDA